MVAFQNYNIFPVNKKSGRVLLCKIIIDEAYVPLGYIKRSFYM
jgi:hypothetical protein